MAMALVEIEGFCAEFIHGDSGSDVAQRITGSWSLLLFFALKPLQVVCLDVVLGTGDILPLVQALGYVTSKVNLWVVDWTGVHTEY